MKTFAALVAGLLVLAGRAPQPQDRGPGYADPHGKDVRVRMKAYPVLAEEGGKRAEKIERLTGDLKCMITEPYAEQPTPYQGSFALQRTKDAVECFIEVGTPSGGKIKPYLQVYQTATTLTIVNHEDGTYSETEIDRRSPAAWRVWSLLVHSAGKEAAEAFEIEVAADGEPRKEFRQRTQEEIDKGWDRLTPEERKKIEEEGAKIAEEMKKSRPCIQLGWQARDKTAFIREANLTLDHGYYFPTRVYARTSDTTVVNLEAANLKTDAPIAADVFKTVPRLLDSGKFRKVK